MSEPRLDSRGLQTPSAQGSVKSEPLLDIRGLKTYFKTDDGMVRAVDGVDITIGRGETVGVVGESGCGKTVTAMSVLKLVPMPPGIIVDGQIIFEGRDLVPLDGEAMDEIRSKEIAIVFQEPMTSLNPVYTIGEQIAEVVRRHEGLSRQEAMGKTIEMLRLVQIPNPERRVRDYPHQFSGGMRQRVMIAMALSCNPKLLIADEPTTALDVTIQAQILDLLQDMKSRFGMAIMLITHAMGVVAETAQRVVVMYAGKVIEEAPVEKLFGQPRHPYTQGLIRSIPRIDLAATKKARLEAIGGVVPSLLDPPPGCRFAARCKFASAKCYEAVPPLLKVDEGHKVACVLYN
jgi:peptide/nickel transport system ATP-binding protein